MPNPLPIYKSDEGREKIQTFYRNVLSTVQPPLQTRVVPTSGGRTHIIEAGRRDADTMLLLHGSASNSMAWLGDTPLWGTRFRIIAPDTPGHPGLSEDALFPLSGGSMARWIGDILEAVGADRVRIVGMSLGAWAGLDYAIRNPKRVLALSVIAPSGLAPVRTSFLFKAIPLSFMGDRGADWVSRLVFNNDDIPDPVLEFGRLVSRHYRPMTEQPRVFPDAELSGLTMPIQYFGGAHDALVRTRESAERISRLLPHTEVHLLADQGHAIIDQGQTIMSFHCKAAT